MPNTKTKYAKRNEKLAIDIRNFLEKHHIAEDTRIYFNNKAYDYDFKTGGFKIINNIDPTDYFEYANKETVAMSFEGELYNVLNYNMSPKIEQEFHDIFTKHNCYFELGNAWNLSAIYD